MDQKKKKKEKKKKKPNNMELCVVHMCDDKPTFHIYIYVTIIKIKKRKK